MTEPFRGGCFCGAVRFAIDEIFDAGYCRCSVCRRMSGDPDAVRPTAHIWCGSGGRSAAAGRGAEAIRRPEAARW